MTPSLCASRSERQICWRDVERAAPGERAFACASTSASVLPLEVLHRDEEDAVLGLPVVDDRDGVRVAQLRGEAASRKKRCWNAGILAPRGSWG